MFNYTTEGSCTNNANNDVSDDEVQWRIVCQSMAFFVHPGNEVMVECIDGSNKYPPISAREDTDRRLAVTRVVFAKDALYSSATLQYLVL